jgi:hypothetical protein
MTMKKRILIVSLMTFIVGTNCFAQSKKDIKKNGIRSVTVTDNENGKSLNNKVSYFDKTGETVEETDYDKDGSLKTIHKYKFNKDGDILEEEEHDGKTKAVEKHIYKYNKLGERIEEQILDSNGKMTKTHYYTYNSKGLKTERKTVDANGKVICVRTYNYTFN